jgi:hypothetical protein
MAGLQRQRGAIEPAWGVRTAERCHAGVDLRGWDTSTRYGASDAADAHGAPWPTPELVAARQPGLQLLGLPLAHKMGKTLGQVDCLGHFGMLLATGRAAVPRP